MFYLVKKQSIPINLKSQMKNNSMIQLLRLKGGVCDFH